MSWKTKWARKNSAGVGGSTESLLAGSTESIDTQQSPLPTPPQIPPIRRVRVSLLGADSFQQGVGKADIAAALMRGLTADYPGKVDPVYDFEFHHGVFEKAWGELLDEPPEGTALTGDRYGMGPLGAWSVQNKVTFDHRAGNEATPPWDKDAPDACAALCAGNPERLSLGAPSGPCMARAIREALSATGHKLDAFEGVHRDLSAKAEARPRELVWVERPCPGILASFARYSPEVGACGAGLPGCCATMLDVFEAGKRPMGSDNNVALLWAAAPNSKIHKSLSPWKLLCAIQDTGSNLARMMREYNWIAGGDGQKEWERKGWRETDLRSKAEFCLSSRNLKADAFFQEKVLNSKNGWIDMELARGFPPVFMMGSVTQRQLLEALGSSKCLDTRVTKSGKHYIRRGSGTHERDVESEVEEEAEEEEGGEKRKAEDEEGGDAKRQATEEEPPKPEPPKEPPKPQFDFSDPNLCWDFVKGFCARGNMCNYSHRGLGQTTLGGNAPLYKLGTRVLIHGLKSQAKFNDRVGECENFDSCTGRWQVRLGDGNRLRVKEDNLRRC